MWKNPGPNPAAHAQVVAPVLLHCLEDPDANVRARAAIQLPDLLLGSRGPHRQAVQASRGTRFRNG
jgi:hypothetical protein